MPSTTALTYIARKSADQTISASTTLADETDLQMTLEAGKNYKFSFIIPINFGSAPDIKFAISTPSSPSASYITYRASRLGTGGGGLSQLAVLSAGDVNAFNTYNLTPSGGATEYVLEINGEIENANDGTFKFQFAQQTSDPNPVTIRRGATLEVKEVA